ncbi:hypothetical protein INTERNEXUS_231 [Bacillus phage vB_BspM_Internexus]|nr:hypothetical protein INTERNEXUS_231 [Bacillus phage vB_BspM_Internexus]
MGLPSLIINFEEIKDPIIRAINEAAISVSVGDVTLDSSSITIDTTEIEKSLDDILSKLGTVDSNVRLVQDASKNILNSLIAHDNNLKNSMDQLGTKLDNILSTTTSMFNILEEIKKQLATEGNQRAIGYSLAVPSVAGSYTKVFTSDKDTILTGITISQSAWNNNDKWSLKIGDFIMFDRIYTKNRGEHKELKKFFPVPANTPVTFQFDNTSSANSKYVWFDIDYIEIDKPTV